MSDINTCVKQRQNIMYKSKGVRWTQYALPLTFIFSRQASNQNIYVHI